MHQINGSRLMLAAVCLMCAGCAPDIPPPEPRGQLDAALLAAVRANQPEEVTALLKRGANADAMASDPEGGATALGIASQEGYVDITAALISAGANVNLRQYGNFDDRTPLFLAVANGHIDIVQSLLEHGAEPNYRFGIDGTQPRAMFYAARDGDEGVVALLLAYGAEIDRRDLEIAILHGHVEVVKRLLGAGADPHWMLPGGRSVMDEARRSPEATRVRMVEAVGAWPGMRRR